MGSLSDIPAWNQNRDPLPDGQEDPYHDTDCGEECAAMRIYYRTGVELPAGVLRELIPGHARRGETSGMDLVGVMRLFGLSPVYKRVATDAVQLLLGEAVRKGIPAIVLGTWVAPTVLHWVLVVGADGGGVWVNDPWGGVRRYIPWGIFLHRYAGECIV